MNLIRYKRVVHLSYPIDEQMPVWPGDPPVSLSTVATREDDGYELRQLCIGEHSGTHLNAARAFLPSGDGTDSIAAGSLVAPAAAIDLTERADGDRDYEATVDDVREWEIAHGRLPRGALVLLEWGWQRLWQVPERFLGIGADGRPRFPGLGVDAARWLLEERSAVGLGTDAPGLEPGIDRSYAVNRLLAEHGAIALENLANLSELPPLGATIAIGVLRMKDATGSPAAVLAFVP